MPRKPSLVTTVVIAACLAPSAAGADCALMGLAAKVVTPSGTAIPKDGGVVVAALPVDRGELAQGDVAAHPEWSLSDDDGRERPTLVTIAPGLVVYRRMSGAAPIPNKDGVVMRHRPGAYDFELQDDREHVLGTFSRAGATPPTLAAPKVKRVHLDQQISRRSRTEVIAELSADPPPDAYALVLADRKGVARSWWTVSPNVRTQTAYHARDCLALPNGTVASRSGDKVTLFWLTIDGRKSPMTGPFTIAANAP